MDTTSSPADPVSPAPVQDRRVSPRGVLPRRVQTWIMAGLALVIVTVILLTGHRQPPPTTGPAPTGPAAELMPPERIRSFQRELADRPVLARPIESQSPDTVTAPASNGGGVPSAPPSDPARDERHQREANSVFADNVAFTRRARVNGTPISSSDRGADVPMPSPEELAAFQRSLMASDGQPRTASAAPSAPLVDRPEPATLAVSNAPPAQPPEPVSAHVGEYRVVEGTVLETVLLNRLDGTYAGPIGCIVTTPVYSEDRQTVLVPTGAKVLGAVAPVQAWGDARLAVTFHRLILPNGQTVSLDQFKGLNQIGETGLKDRVDRHYRQVFGASVAIGALSGLAQWGTRGSTGGFGDAYRQSAGTSMASSAERVLDRYLNVLPTLTIREGHRIKVYLTGDLYLPAYHDPRLNPEGGA